MFISRSTAYSFTITFLLALRCYLSGRYGILRPACSRQWRPLRELEIHNPGGGRCPRRLPHDSGKPVQDAGRADEEGGHNTLTVAAPEIGHSYCDTVSLLQPAHP